MSVFKISATLWVFKSAYKYFGVLKMLEIIFSCYTKHGYFLQVTHQMSLYAMYMKRVVTAMEEKESRVINVATAKVLLPQIAVPVVLGSSVMLTTLSYGMHTRGRLSVF